MPHSQPALADHAVGPPVLMPSFAGDIIMVSEMSEQIGSEEFQASQVLSKLLLNASAEIGRSSVRSLAL
eukprot:SAG11_NODE_1330_length_5187_cov_6.700079_4_plen_69_part_00